MAYRYRSRRAVKRLKRKSKRSFIITLVIIGFLLYATLNWILPYFIGGISIVKNVIEPPQTKIKTDQSLAAPPVLNIPFEATASSMINISGFSTPNSKVTLFLDDETKDTVNVASDGSFIFENVPLVLGTNNIYGKTSDGNKESLPSKTIRLIYDNEKPLITLFEPEDGKTIQGGDKKVKVSGKTEASAKVFLNDAQIVVDQNGDFATDIPLNDGDNTISIKASDIASNTTEIQRRVVFQP